MKNELTYDELVLIAGGHTAFQLLCAAVELDVFTFLSRNPGSSSAKIAEAAGLREVPEQLD